MTKRTEQEWQQVLTPEEFRVCRQKGTERPFTGELLDNKQQGSYLCKCCGSELFVSEHKFDSGCGWPSFYAESEQSNVDYQSDSSHGMQRVEILCKNCDAHLGHVFDDGPLPTGKRYCVNSVSLTFAKNNPDQ